MKLFTRKSILLLLLTGNLISCGSTAIQAKTVQEYSMCAVHQNNVCRVDYHPSKPLLASASSEHMVKLFRESNGQIVNEFEHPEGVPALAFSNAGDLLATAAYDAVIRIWDITSGELKSTLPGHDQIVRNVAFSPNDKLLASVSSDDTIRLWNLKTKTYKTLGKHNGDIWGLAFHPNGQWVLSGGEDNLIKVWNVNTGALAQTLPQHTGAVLAIAFSHDGSLMASGGDDYTIKLWDTVTWQSVTTFSEGSYSIYGLAFSPDDSVLVSGGRDKGLLGEFMQYHFNSSDSADSYGVTMRVWDVKGKKLLKEMRGHGDDVKDVRFSANGKKLASSSTDGIIKIWDMAQVLK